MQHFQRLKVAFITTLGFTFYANRKFYKTLISPMTVVPGSHALPRLDIATYWQNIFCYLSTSFFFFFSVLALSISPKSVKIQLLFFYLKPQQVGLLIK